MKCPVLDKIRPAYRGDEGNQTSASQRVTAEMVMNTLFTPHTRSKYITELIPHRVLPFSALLTATQNIQASLHQLLTLLVLVMVLVCAKVPQSLCAE